MRSCSYKLLSCFISQRVFDARASSISYSLSDYVWTLVWPAGSKRSTSPRLRDDVSCQWQWQSSEQLRTTTQFERILEKSDNGNFKLALSELSQ
eukprot:2407207-Amphidinium_carterae.1